MYDVWTDGTDDALTGAMTDVLYSVQMDGTDDAWTGAMTDILYSVQTDVDFTVILCRYFTACFSHYYQGFSMVFQQTVMR